MKRCPSCGAERMKDATSEEEIRVGRLTFATKLPAETCGKCSEALVSGAALERFELQVARLLATMGVSTGEAFRFMRKAIGLKAIELAELLDITPEHLSKWENGKHPVDHNALTVLGSLVRDRLDRRPGTLEQLRALRNPKTPSRRTWVEPEDLQDAAG